MQPMTPRFDEDVLHVDNRAILTKTTDLAVHSINVSLHRYIYIIMKLLTFYRTTRRTS